MRTKGTGRNQVTYRNTTKADPIYNHCMTNEKRVQLAAIDLLAAGYIQPASDELKMYYIGKKVYICLEPEAIDTYMGWKKRGYHVKKGQQAITAIKLCSAGGFMGYQWKEYTFFSQSQVAR